MADDKRQGEHHSKLKGAIIGGLAGKAIAGDKGAAAGAAIGAEKQHKKNEEERQGKR
jgi:outer membrane lipoprotein SlyB